MAAGEGVVLALGGGGEGLDAAQFPVRAELLSPARQYLVAVCLMAHVPYDAVFRRVVDIVQRNGDLCHAETRRQMTGIHRHLLNDVLAQFLAKQGQFVHRQLA